MSLQNDVFLGSPNSVMLVLFSVHSFWLPVEIWSALAILRNERTVSPGPLAAQDNHETRVL